MGQQYTLTVYNKSTYSGQVIVYQGKPHSNISASEIMPLAWLSEGIEGNEGPIVNSVQFSWTY